MGSDADLDVCAKNISRSRCPQVPHAMPGTNIAYDLLCASAPLQARPVLQGAGTALQGSQPEEIQPEICELLTLHFCVSRTPLLTFLQAAMSWVAFYTLFTSLPPPPVVHKPLQHTICVTAVEFASAHVVAFLLLDSTRGRG